jgi:hypothetical protein
MFTCLSDITEILYVIDNGSEKIYGRILNLVDGVDNSYYEIDIKNKKKTIVDQKAFIKELVDKLNKLSEWKPIVGKKEDFLIRRILTFEDIKIVMWFGDYDGGYMIAGDKKCILPPISIARLNSIFNSSNPLNMARFISNIALWRPFKLEEYYKTLGISSNEKFNNEDLKNILICYMSSDLKFQKGVNNMFQQDLSDRKDYHGYFMDIQRKNERDTLLYLEELKKQADERKEEKLKADVKDVVNTASQNPAEVNKTEEKLKADVKEVNKTEEKPKVDVKDVVNTASQNPTEVNKTELPSDSQLLVEDKKNLLDRFIDFLNSKDNIEKYIEYKGADHSVNYKILINNLATHREIYVYKIDDDKNQEEIFSISKVNGVLKITTTIKTLNTYKANFVKPTIINVSQAKTLGDIKDNVSKNELDLFELYFSVFMVGTYEATFKLKDNNVLEIKRGEDSYILILKPDQEPKE